jgi:N-glycosylase/DNA lyase
MRSTLLLNCLVSLLGAEIRAFPSEAPRFAVETRPSEIWRQKLFCVLSSQVRADKASLATDCILRRIPFFEGNLRLREIEEACFAALTEPDVRYRFPRSRSRYIACCWFAFWQIKDQYQEYVQSLGSEHRARAEVTKVFPGIGLKQASMFLRNIGAARDLAIIDAHVLTYLRICHAWENFDLTPQKYLEAEDILRREALYFGLDLSAYDPIVWSAVKAIKKVERHV